jgi:CelD/BcsL family acetyltransferase involved in cellulose biosynthesis
MSTPKKHFVEILCGKDDWRKNRSDYEALHARSSRSNPFMAPLWMDAWNAIPGKNREPVILNLRDETRTLVLSWHFFQSPAPNGFGLWPVMSECADILDPLEADHDKERAYALARALAALLESAQFIWIPLLSREWLEKSTLLPELMEHNRILRLLLRKRSTRHQLRLPDGNFEAYAEAALGNKSRKMLRQSENRLSREGNWILKNYPADASIHDGMRQLEAAEKQSWQFGKGFCRLTNPDMGPFFRRIIQDAAPSGRVSICCLELNKKPIAADFCLHQGSNSYLFETVFNQEYQRFSPGKLLLYHRLESSFKQGSTCFDFLQGDHGYKQDWANHSEDLCDLLLTRKDFSGWCQHHLVAATGLISKWRRNPN